MPIGAHVNHANGIGRGVPVWFRELISCWNDMEVVPLSQIRKHAIKRGQLGKAFYFEPSQLPQRFADNSTVSLQANFRITISNFFAAYSLVSSEHFHISFIELNEDDYRIPGTPRICYVWRCASQGFGDEQRRLTAI